MAHTTIFFACPGPQASYAAMMKSPSVSLACRFSFTRYNNTATRSVAMGYSPHPIAARVASLALASRPWLGHDAPMKFAFSQAILSGIVTALTWSATSLRADEGMWLYNHPPRALLMQKYGFNPSDEWLAHLQQSSVRFNSGGSGEFVSEDGLLMSNHHVGADALQKMGDKEHNYVHDGFYARKRADEKKCLDLELNVLASIEDVTDQVNAAVKPGMTGEQSFAARRGAIAGIEKQSRDQTGLRSDVVTLYQGGQYQLYRFKKYTDVRLVFAPEQQIAFFGGDPDNFEYPRFNLDICLFRAYENGHPAKIQHFLKWDTKSLTNQELVFVSGHPGHTSRSLTVAELQFLRDVGMPFRLERLKRMEVLLSSWSERSDENARRAKKDLFGVQNSRKARDGVMAGLLTPSFFARKQQEEQRLREAAGVRPEFAESRTAWDRIAEAQKVIGGQWLRYSLLETASGFGGDLFQVGRTLLRAGEEFPKPNAERLREFGEAGRESLELSLFSEKPIYDDLEILDLSDSLTFLAEKLGPDSEVVRQVLAGQSPRARAAQLVRSTGLKSVAVRRQLYQGGKAAVEAAKDPMIELARLVDGEARALRTIIETQEEAKKQAHAQIAKLRFALEGANTYPDATFTLRLAFGAVKGYEEDGQAVPFQTTFAGLYQRARQHQFRAPFDLPERWVKRERRLNPQTPFNFICTADIIGGNSGSPVVNRQGEFVGIIFDGNIQSLVADLMYTEDQARALAVHAASIIEALQKVYDAKPLAEELLGKRKPSAR